MLVPAHKALSPVSDSVGQERASQGREDRGNLNGPGQKNGNLKATPATVPYHQGQCPGPGTRPRHHRPKTTAGRIAGAQIL